MNGRFWLILTCLGIITGAGCSSVVTHHKKDFGMGECTEYVPNCFNGTLTCTTDEKGCRICECQQRAQFPDPTETQ